MAARLGIVGLVAVSLVAGVLLAMAKHEPTSGSAGQDRQNPAPVVVEDAARWRAAKGEVDGAIPSSQVHMAIGTTVEGNVFLSITGSRSHLSATAFYTDLGATRSKAICLESSGVLRDGVEAARITLVEGTGADAVYTVTVEATASSCRSTEVLVGVEGAFAWGAAGERFASRAFKLIVRLPEHPAYADAGVTKQVELAPYIPSDSPYWQYLAALLMANHGTQEQACMVLGQQVRIHAVWSSVPDVVLICDSAGVAKALEFMRGVADGAAEYFDVVATLYTAATDPAIDPYATDLECDEVEADGTCLPEGYWDPELGWPDES